MQFILLPFALCFLLYIRQENRYHFWAATALKVTLTLTLALCLLVALAASVFSGIAGGESGYGAVCRR